MPKVSLALLQPAYAKEFEFIGIHPFSDFAERMGDDFNHLLVARKYTVQGPFPSYDEIIYSVKAKTDLLISIKIDLKFTNNSFPSKQINIPVYENQYWSCGKVEKALKNNITKYSYEGTAGLTGNISIVASECMTKEIVWTKNVSIDPEYFSVKSEKMYENPNVSASSLWTNDPGFYNPLVNQLEKFYSKTMQKAWNYLDPRELESLMPDIEKIREKSGFQRK